jgi:hypothetical protein
VTGPQHEDEFEAYLTRRLPIHQRLSPLERLEPPDELDRLIIAKARQAIQSPSPVRVFRAPKWALPVGLAATIVISFTVLLNLGVHAVKHQEEPVLMTNVTVDRPTVAAPMVQAPQIAIAPAKSSAAKRAGGAPRPAVPEQARDSAARLELPKAAREIDAAAPAVADTPVETQSTAIADTFNRPLPAPSARSAGRAAAPPLPDAGSWFKRIEKLRAEGKTAEAEQEFRRFRDVYPGYEPPERAPPADGPTK